MKEEAVLTALEKKVKQYTPEWKYDPIHLDPGGALMRIYADMYQETLERLGNIPHKYYIELLNLLEVDGTRMQPATGMVQFNVVGDEGRTVLVEEGTKVYADVMQGGEEQRVVFETTKPFVATSASIEHVYNVDPVQDVIEEATLGEEVITFFAPEAERNMQQHVFVLGHPYVFELHGKGTIILEVRQNTHKYLQQVYLEQLTNPQIARWFYYTQEEQKHWFDKVSVKEDRIYLTKESDVPVGILEESEGAMGVCWIGCELHKADKELESIVVDEITVASTSMVDGKDIGVVADALYADDHYVDVAHGGYCFGRELLPYNCFYIGSKEALGKKGATIHLEIDMKVVSKEVGESPFGLDYLFRDKYIIEKKDLKTMERDCIRITDLRWEYWNGMGWYPLSVTVKGNFCEKGVHSIDFICPQDLSPILHNAVENNWIRGRIIAVENNFSNYGMMELPYVKQLTLSYAYADLVPLPMQVIAVNNAGKEEITINSRKKEMITLFSPLPSREYAVYLGFEQKPEGYPIHLYFQLEGSLVEGGDYSYEYLKGKDTWEEVKVLDETEGLENDGVVALYVPPHLYRDTIFGKEAYWLRIVDKNRKYKVTESTPKVSNIHLNVAKVVQQETKQNERFIVDEYQVKREIQLSKYPVLQCEVWIEELHSLGERERDLLLATNKEAVKVKYATDGTIESYWVKWESCENQLLTGPTDRAYQIEHCTGKIIFGDGIHGRIPPKDTKENLQVTYSYGGGEIGNLAVGKVERMVYDIPYVEQVRNIVPTCGGSDRNTQKVLEKVGVYRLKNKNRAVTLEDYERLVYEYFAEVSNVKGFANREKEGNKAYGHIAIVVEATHGDNPSYIVALCKRIYHFLLERSSCQLDPSKLHVVPAIKMMVNVTVKVALGNYDQAFYIEKEIKERLSLYLGNGERGSNKHAIGELPERIEIYRLLKGINHVAYIKEVSLEGVYYEYNTRRVIPLDEKYAFPYVRIQSGVHTVVL